MAYVTKDSGKKQAFKSGYQRDSREGKPRYDLIPGEPLKRLAELYARGAVKYGDSNWKLSNTDEEYARFKESAFRHFMQWFYDWDKEEDHAAAVVWGIFGYEWHTKHKAVDKKKDK